MAIQDEIRTDLENEVFSVIGKSVTLKSKSTPVYNDRGEEENQTYTSSTITIVPYNITNDSETFQRWGVLNSGEMDVAVPYTVTIAKGDLLTIESEDWRVKEIELNYLPDNVVTIIRITREHY